MFEQHREEFVSNVNSLCDIAHADLFELIKINEDRIFFTAPKPVRPNHLPGVVKKLTKNQKMQALKNFRRSNDELPMLHPKLLRCHYEPPQENLPCESMVLHEYLPMLIANAQFEINKLYRETIFLIQS